jgi:PAS domain S-box-containing protein
MNHQTNIVKDISILYELSLAIGCSLDLEENCKIFLDRLMSRKALAFAGVWIDKNRLEYEVHSERNCALAYGTPKFRINFALDSHEYITKRLLAESMFSISAAEADFEQVIQEKNIEGGTYALFRLGDVGFLKLYSTKPNAFSKIEMFQLRNVLQKFTISLEACMSHISLKSEIENRLRIENELARSEEKYRLVVQNLSEGLVVTDSEDKITFVNDAMCRLSGHSKNELIGQIAYKIFLPKEEWQSIEHKIVERKRGESSNYEKQHVMKDGSVWWGAINGSPLIDTDGQIIGSLAAITDITERKIAEQKREQLVKELEETNKDLDDFAYIVSHDLKAPLRAIGSLSDWLYMDYAHVLDDVGREQMDLLRGRVRRLHNFIDAILSYSRIGRTQLKVEEFNLQLLVEQNIDLLRPLENCEINILTPLPNIRGEKVRIGQVFQNLISNGLKYNDKSHKVINITHHSTKNNYIFEIEDNGMGIDSRYFGKIFQIFQTLEARDNFESTGIGLTIVKKIIESHKGTIRIVSTPKVGSKFIFSLPR